MYWAPIFYSQPIQGTWLLNMITESGYSKDTSIMPEGIVITWGKEMIQEKGGLKRFIRYFEVMMQQEGVTWLQKCKNKPRDEKHILYVYIIVANRLAYRCYYMGYETGPRKVNMDSWSSSEVITWPRVVMAGPVEKCPFKRELKGFQGFRYCTKLF